MESFIYQVLLGEKREILFITTTANKIDTIRILTMYYFMKNILSSTISISDFFQHHGYLLIDHSDIPEKIYKILSENKYKTLDLSKIDDCISKIFLK